MRIWSRSVTPVEAGTVIATVGRSGRATAHHLHFEIRHGGMVYNPRSFSCRAATWSRAERRVEMPEPDEDDEDE